MGTCQSHFIVSHSDVTCGAYVCSVRATSRYGQGSNGHNESPLLGCTVVLYPTFLYLVSLRELPDVMEHSQFHLIRMHAIAAALRRLGYMSSGEVADLAWQVFPRCAVSSCIAISSRGYYIAVSIQAGLLGFERCATFCAYCIGSMARIRLNIVDIMGMRGIPTVAVRFLVLY